MRYACDFRTHKRLERLEGYYRQINISLPVEEARISSQRAPIAKKMSMRAQPMGRILMLIPFQAHQPCSDPLTQPVH
jgi:hypothetical protein